MQISSEANSTHKYRQAEKCGSGHLHFIAFLKLKFFREFKKNGLCGAAIMIFKKRFILSFVAATHRFAGMARGHR